MSSDATQILELVTRLIENLDDHRLGYTVEDAAERLGLGVSVVRDAISRGELKAKKCGRYWMIRKDYLLQWLAAKG